jgi:Rieske Fe-S protein
MVDRSDETRRAFLERGILAAAALGVGGCALFLKKADPDLRLAATGGEVRVPRAALPWAAGGREFLVVEVAGMEDKVLLFRSRGGELVALSMTCTHRGCDVEYRPEPEAMACPCHGSEYDLEGKVTRGPAKLPLRRFAVREEGDAVLVVVGA